MSTYDSGHHKPGRTTGQHSKDDALDQREFEQLLEGCHRLDDYYSLECQFVVLVAGRLGLRAGEIAHFRSDWINWRRDMLEIPRHQPCESGRDGSICGQCRLKAEQRVAHNEDLTIEEAERMAWSAKTDAAARSVPIGADARASIVLERFCDKYDAWPHSQNVVNRRVSRAAEAADEIVADEVYPHALRATAATHWVAEGLDIFALTSMMGWADLQTAECYIRSSGERTAQAIRDL